MRWSQEEYDVLLLAIEKGGTSSGVIDFAQEKTGRSRKSIERKLMKIGFLNSFGVSNKIKSGFVG